MQLKSIDTVQYDVAENIMRQILDEFDCEITTNTATDDVLKTTQDALEYYITNFNPWAAYAKNYLCGAQNPKFILNDVDKQIIDRHNIRNRGTAKEIQTDNLLPTPFVGNLKTAKFVMLLKNPGLDVEDKKRINHDNWVSAVLNNLKSPLGYTDGMLFLRPNYQTFVNNTKDSGDKWWNRNIKNVKTGLNQLFASDKIYEHVADIELFPYASVLFGELKHNTELVTTMSSCFFTKCLIRYVMGRGVPIFIRAGMIDFIPELQLYKVGGKHPYAGRLFTNRNMAHISAGNLKQVDTAKDAQAVFNELLLQIQSVK